MTIDTSVFTTGSSQFILTVSKPWDAYTRLISILTTEQDHFYDNSLSKKLAQWSFEVLELIHTKKKDLISINTSLQILIDQLVNEILINPHDGAHLEEPVIQEEERIKIVYERWMVNHFESTLKEKFLKTTFRSHVFAQKIILFLDDLHKQSGGIGYLAWAHQKKIEEGITPKDYETLALKAPEDHYALCEQLIQDAICLETGLDYLQQKEQELILEQIEHEKTLKTAVLTATSQEASLDASLQATHTSQLKDSTSHEAWHHTAEELTRKTNASIDLLDTALKSHLSEKTSILSTCELKITADRDKYAAILANLEAVYKQKRRDEKAIISELAPQIAGIRSAKYQLFYDKYATKADISCLTRQDVYLTSEIERLEARNQELTDWVYNHSGGGSSCQIM